MPKLRRPNRTNVLRADANIYDPVTGRSTGRTTVGNYVNSTPQQVFPADGRVYLGNAQQYGRSATGSPLSTQQTTPTAPSGGDDGTRLAGGELMEAEPLEPQLVEYPPGTGFYYDLNDDIQRQAFYDRRLLDLQDSRDQQIAHIDQQIADLTGSSKDYVRNYFKQLEDFGTVKSTGDMNRIDTYSAASPNAFQSSEGTSYNLANTNYLKGVGEAADKANQDVGADFIANPNDVNLLGDDTTYGRQLQNYFGGRNQVGEEYNDYLAGIQQQNNPSTNPFAYAYQAAGLQAPGAVDISRFNPFVDFKRTTAAATPGPGFRPAGGRNFTEQTPVDNFLGRNQIQDQRDKDYLRQFLLGRV